MVFSISAKQAAAIVSLLAATVQGHMVLLEPPPFTFPDPSTKQSPLLETGADFPCKFPAGHVPPEQSPTALKSGAGANTMSFKGGATHEGGSCQISLTSDKVPTKSSKWEVIKSIEGGCPSDATGNLSGDPNDLGSNKFTYTVPDDMAPGQYTLAWTWFNRVGNREMYMNCAPVSIGGGATKREFVKVNKKRQSTRPDMFLANIGTGCATQPGQDVAFPEPGKDLEMGPGAKVTGPAGDSCGAAGTQPAPTAPTSSSPTATGGAYSGGAGAGTSDGTFADGAAAPSAPLAPTAPAPAPAAPSAPAAPAPAAPAPGGPCTEGTYVCAADGSSYNRCASGAMSASMPVAPGTKCVPGESADLALARAKRGLRFARSFA
jgi:hypothetical protein